MGQRPMREPSRGASRVSSLLVVLLASCGGTEAEALADQFVDRVFVRFDQRSGLALTDGRARVLLERELRLVGDVRGSNVGSLREQPRVYYDRGTSSVVRSRDGDVTVVPYDVTTRVEHGEMHRVVRVSVALRRGRLRVVDYETREPSSGR